MPSLKEGLPLALLEGMSGHLPIIASDIPEMRDIILGAGGIAVTPKDIPSLTQALKTYLSLDLATLDAKGEQVYQYLVKNHSIEDYKAAYKELIESQLKARQIK
jgi:glycosyltransferase involved in cell wall biosynthesis